MPAKPAYQGADQNRTGVCHVTGISGVSPRAREQVRTDFKPEPKPKKAPKRLKRTAGFRRNPTLAAQFRFAVLHEFGGRCQMGWFTNASGTSVFCSGDLDPCHIIPKQTLRNLGLKEKVAYDPRNGIALCRCHHERNDRGIERVPRGLLPPSVFEFARDHNLTHVLDKLYERSTG